MIFRDDDALRIFAFIEFGSYTQTCVCPSIADKLNDRLLGFFLLLMAALPLPPVIHRALLIMAALGGALVAMVLVVHLWSRRREGDGPLSTLLSRLAEGSRAVARPQLLALGAACAVGEWMLTSVVASLAARSLVRGNLLSVVYTLGSEPAIEGDNVFLENSENHPSRQELTPPKASPLPPLPK